MAKVTFKRVATDNDVNNVPVLDGQLIYSGEGKTYMDYETTRVPINGTPDSAMSSTSTNPVSNNVIKTYVDTQIGNLNIPSATLLWTNPSPSSSISSATNISLSSNDYDILEIYYRPFSTGSNTLLCSKIPKGYGTTLCCFYGGSGGDYSTRSFARNSDTSYTIGTESSTYSDRTIPVYVVGYKYGITFQ